MDNYEATMYDQALLDEAPDYSCGCGGQGSCGSAFTDVTLNDPEELLPEFELGGEA